MKKASLIIMSCFYILAGINHFINPAFYLKIMPRYIPSHLFLVYLSAVIEITLGTLLFIKKFQTITGWLIIAMLFAFLPVHVQMIIDNYGGLTMILLIALIRLPLQFALIYWTYKTCNLRLK